MWEYDFKLVDKLLDLEFGPVGTSSSKTDHGKNVPDRSVYVEEQLQNGKELQEKVSRKSSFDGSEGGRSVGLKSITSSRHQDDVADIKSTRHDDRRRQTQDEERKKRMDKSLREDCSVMVMGLHPQAGDREVYEFFSKEAGKVRDVYVIRDSRTGKSKGVAYVEFYLQESVIKALGCNGRTIHGSLIRVQASGAEKNRAAEAQKAAQTFQQEKPVMLYLMGLSGILSEISESELRQIFSVFGSIDMVTIGTDPYTGRSRGFAYVQYQRAVDAREAMAAMNGYELAGQVIQVGYLARSLEGVLHGSTNDSQQSDYLRSNEQRQRLMETLKR